MKSFRNPKYLERYEDVIFDLEQPLVTADPANNAAQKVYPIIYFDLTKQKMDIKDGVTKLAFLFELSANPDADYNFYALVLHEREAEMKQEDGKLLLRD